MFKYEFYKQSNGYQCSLILSNWYGDNNAPLIESNKFLTESEDIKRWTLSNVDTFLTGTLDAFIIRLKHIKKEVFFYRKGGDMQQRQKFMTNYWLVLQLQKELNYNSTPFAKATLIKGYFDALTGVIPHDERLNFQLFLEMTKDIIKASNFIIKALNNYTTKPATAKTSKTNARRI